MADRTANVLPCDVPTFTVKDPIKDAEKLINAEGREGNFVDGETTEEKSPKNPDDEHEMHAPIDDDESDTDAACDCDNLTTEEMQKLHEEALAAKDEGNTAFRETRYDESIKIYTDALSKCSRNLYVKDCAALYSNRAAAKLKLKMYTPAVQDCTRCIDLDKGFTRAYYRRATAYEALEKYEEAAKDYQEVLKLDASVKEAGEALQRLPKLMEERNERLKNEMFGKLKQLGNSILRPFGMSVNNFKLEQDGQTGGYSVKYDQNARK